MTRPEQAEVEQANNLCLQALRALVELKDYRDKVGKDAEYFARKDEVWEAAREALKSIEKLDPEFGHHIDDWLDCPTFGKDGDENYARFVFEYFRYPAWKQTAYRQTMLQHPLFCTYGTGRFRVTGASRMGDVWLARKMTQVDGYDIRVNVGDCYDWSDKA